MGMRIVFTSGYFINLLSFRVKMHLGFGET